MKINAYLILLIAIFPLVSQAQSNNPFSQLEFDKKVEKVSREDKLKEILGSEEEKAKSQVDGAVIGTEEIKTALSQYHSKEYLLEGPASFLTPRIKGPMTDPKNNTYITSEMGWPYTKGAFCKIPDTVDSLCKKSKALKEVLARFSGNDDFYEVTCKEHSCASGEKAVLVALEVPQVEEGVLDMTTIGSECRYYLQKGVTKNWVLMHVKSAICSCLPADCLNKK